MTAQTHQRMAAAAKQRHWRWMRAIRFGDSCHVDYRLAMLLIYVLSDIVWSSSAGKAGPTAIRVGPALPAESNTP